MNALSQLRRTGHRICLLRNKERQHSFNGPSITELKSDLAIFKPAIVDCDKFGSANLDRLNSTTVTDALFFKLSLEDQLSPQSVETIM